MILDFTVSGSLGSGVIQSWPIRCFCSRLQIWNEWGKELEGSRIHLCPLEPPGAARHLVGAADMLLSYVLRCDLGSDSHLGFKHGLPGDAWVAPRAFWEIAFLLKSGRIFHLQLRMLTHMLRGELPQNYGKKKTNFMFFLLQLFQFNNISI